MSDFKQDKNIPNKDGCINIPLFISSSLEEAKKDLPATLEEDNNKLVSSMMEAKSQEELNSFLALFNLNQNKKNILRILKYNNLLDAVTEEALRRYEKVPDEISNKELLDCMNIVSSQLDRSRQNLEGIASTTPTIQLNQQKNEININVDSSSGLTQDEKNNVISVVNQILAMAKTQETIDTQETDSIIGSVPCDTIDIIDSDETQDNE